MKKTLFLIGGLIVCLATLSSFIKLAQSDAELSKKIVGEWRNIYLKIVIHHPGKQPETVEADSTNWEQQLGIKPIRTHFKSDGTYTSEYRNLKDSIVKIASGTWTIKSDSLIMNQSKPSASLLKLHVDIAGTKATFKGVIDFEGDGLKDDEYYGQQRKFDR